MPNLAERYTPKYAKIDNAAASGATAVVAAVPGQRIIPLSYSLVTAGITTVKWQSASTDLTGAMSFAANGGLSDADAEAGLMSTAASEALNINAGSAVQVSGRLTYITR